MTAVLMCGMESSRNGSMESSRNDSMGEQVKRTRIKFCGMMREKDILAVNEVLPDYCGFILAEGRRRSITPQQAAGFYELLDRRVKAVGVFLNDPEDRIAAIAAEGVFDVIQLHGSEDADFIRRIRERTGLPVIKAFSVKGAGDLEAAARSPADHVLLDHGTGGTGERFDWSLLKDFERPYFLAGGLNPDNLREALTQLTPWAADLSSGIESRGMKDGQKMRQCAEILRGFGAGAWTAGGKE